VIVTPLGVSVETMKRWVIGPSGQSGHSSALFSKRREAREPGLLGGYKKRTTVPCIRGIRRTGSMSHRLYPEEIYLLTQGPQTLVFLIV